jgi:hypothetical protein
LEVGQSQDVSAAGLKFPDLTLEILSQRYTWLETDRYLYQSRFRLSSELVVDDLGPVVILPGGWEQMASLSSPGSAKPRL